MYFRKARLDQRPISMIEKTGTPVRYMAIAAPDRIECVPTSERSISSFVSPMATTPSLSRFVTISDVMLMVLFLCGARETGEFRSVPLRVRIRLMSDDGGPKLDWAHDGIRCPPLSHGVPFSVILLSFESD
jgi:hypothetical protein